MNRTRPFQLRLTDVERESWERQARSESLSVSELVRRRMRPGLRPSSEDLAAILVSAPALMERDRGLCRHNRLPSQYCPKCDKT